MVTVVVFALLAIGVVSTPGWPRVHETFFNGFHARESFDAILHGFWINVQLFLICEPVILVLGARGRPGPHRAQPLAAARAADRGRPTPTSSAASRRSCWSSCSRSACRRCSCRASPTARCSGAGVALVLSYGAYVAEVFRAGIDSIHPSQVYSASALGLSRGQTMRFVVVPQAVRRVIPPLLNDFVSLQKDTALVAAAGVFDAVFAARDYGNFNFNYTPLVVVAGFFVVMTVPAGPVLRLAAAPVDGARAGGCAVTALLELDDVRKSYGDRVVLADIDLTVNKHDVVCLIGSSGSGKSTLLRCLNLLEQIDDGVIRFDGEEISDPRVDPRAVRRGSGWSSRPTTCSRTCRSSTTACWPRSGCTAYRAPRRWPGPATCSTRFGLSDQVDKHPDRLSGGQQQRAALVRALCTEPELLLLDEITAALDPELVGDVLTIVRDLAEAGTTMVLATHEMSFARDVATTVCFLDDGRILEQGPPSTMLVAPEQERTRQFLRRVLPRTG